MADGNGASPATQDKRGAAFLRLFHVTAKAGGEVRWRHDVVAAYESDAEDLAREFVLSEESLHDLALERLSFSSERARALAEPYGWVIGVR